MLLAGCAKPEVQAPVIAIWESAPDAPRHVRLELYQKKSVIDYADIHIEVVTKIRGDALFWVSEPDSEGRPQAGTEEVQFAAIQKNRDLVIRFVPALADDSRLAPYVLHKKAEPGASSQRLCLSRPVLTHVSRQAQAWLTFDVRQKI
ncbi:MAG: hypothetical protein NVV63_18455 [Opitutus sp.]|nr:hypothetical protein [Opitutus sp.]